MVSCNHNKTKNNQNHIWQFMGHNSMINNVLESNVGSGGDACMMMRMYLWSFTTVSKWDYSIAWIQNRSVGYQPEARKKCRVENILRYWTLYEISSDTEPCMKYPQILNHGAESDSAGCGTKCDFLFLWQIVKLGWIWKLIDLYSAKHNECPCRMSKRY